MNKTLTHKSRIHIPVLILLLLAWALRLCCLDTVPPGWRDDELINIHALSGEVLAGRFPLYFTGASGHEPLYHYLHAAVHAVLGFNVLSGHVLSVACGMCAVALTYVLTARLFGRTTAAVASLAQATSFWSLMYSRTAIRHIIVPPCVLLTLYLFWRTLEAHAAPDRAAAAHRLRATGRTITPREAPFRWRTITPRKAPFRWRTDAPTKAPFRWRTILVGLALGASLYTYPAARLLPALLILFAVYVALFHAGESRYHRRELVLALAVALAVAALLAVPMGVAIVQGRSAAAAQGIGADARLDELAVPWHELKAGNPRPLLENVWQTLGMFHATGDSEWLYNVPERPVFNLLGGVLLWVGVGICLCRWRQPRYFFLLLWLAFGLLPAFVSVPPASLSHTIMAMPVAYILPALALTEGFHWLRQRGEKPGFLKKTWFLSWSLGLLIVLFLVTNAVRDLRDYFFNWPERGMVGFLYRADYRTTARYLNATPAITDVAVSSSLMGPWDRLALEVDTRRGDVSARLFDPQRALLYPAGETAHAILTLTHEADPLVEAALERDGAPLRHVSNYERIAVIAFSGQREWWPHQTQHWVSQIPLQPFANGMSLLGWSWPEGTPGPGRTTPLLTAWDVSQQLDLPPMPIVANPPPPGVYSGRRLAVFAHLLTAEGAFMLADDGLWVDPLTLQPGDRFFQIHRFALPSDATPGPYTVELGLYDPMTGERWPVLEAQAQTGPDYVTFSVEEAR